MGKKRLVGEGKWWYGATREVNVYWKTGEENLGGGAGEKPDVQWGECKKAGCLRTVGE